MINLATSKFAPLLPQFEYVDKKERHFLQTPIEYLQAWCSPEEIVRIKTENRSTPKFKRTVAALSRRKLEETHRDSKAVLESNHQVRVLVKKIKQQLEL